MTDLTGLVRSELTTLADSVPPPTDLADRAVTAGVRRRRWRRAATAGTAVAAAVAVTLAATQFLALPAPRSTGQQPAATEARNVVFARFKGEQAEILNPTTGQYRAVAVSVVMEPSADLRYAPVLPPVAKNGEGTGTVPIDKRIGRYDTTTGEIRWYDPPLRWAAPPTISPDGRYLAAPIYNPETRAWGAMVVDAQTADARVLNLAAETVAAKDVLVGGLSYDEAGALTVAPRYALDVVLSWRPDSHHFLIGNAIVDLTGRQTGTVPIPDAWLIAPRPNGEGMLAVPKGALDTYILTNASGRDVHRHRADWACTAKKPTECSLLVFGGFLGWRGTNHMLVKSPDDPGRGIDAIDVRTGQRARVGTHDASRVIVMPADSLPPGVRDAVSF